VLAAATPPALRDARLRLATVALDTLTACMTLLGIDPLDRI
jgi:arginyl-tRNA synthetase